MDVMKWFVEQLEQMTGERALLEEVGFEAVELYHDEIGNEFIPLAHLAKLPDPLLVETFVYHDSEGCEWIAGIVIGEHGEGELYTFWMRNGESVKREFTKEKREL
ncbi:hypothetical protein [Domibacillus tundrae]|uniref:hypothetical protein n=1 Tax=Domibacillus tundrae TaxID=1587527 RepID=UPI000617AFB3|nr:hypothetical protein [Domibacillus tundrae]